MIAAFAILGITIGVLVWGRIRADLVAVLSVLALFLAGVIDTGQALAGFSNSAVIMIATLFIVGEGLSQTGVTTWAGNKMVKLAGKSQTRLLILMMGATAILSAFISNTGTVAALMPAVVVAAWRMKSVPARFLMPLAFAANAGGLLTLTGTPPNIVVADALKEAGHAPFSFFEYAMIGLPLLIAAIGFMVFFGQKLLPKGAAADPYTDVLTEAESMTEAYIDSASLFRLKVLPESPLVGQSLARTGLGPEYRLPVLSIDRSGPDGTAKDLSQTVHGGRLLDTRVLAGDVLLVRGTMPSVERAIRDLVLSSQPLKPEDDKLAGKLLSPDMGVAEVLITPRSDYIGGTIARGMMSEKRGIQVLSVLRQNKPVEDDEVELRFGDALLVRGKWEDISRLKSETRNFVVVGSPDTVKEELKGFSPQTVIAVGSLVGMVALMVTGLVPNVIAVLMAAAAMILGRCLTTDQAYRSVSWSSVVLIGSMIPMGIALQTTGGAAYVANALVATLGQIHPIAILAGIFLLTAGFSQVINNTATSVLMAPIVLQTAENLSVSPYPLMIILAVSASTAFLTPIGTTTNLLVMAPGGYRFKDYMKVGAPLSLLFLVISLVLVPIIWPF
jgi:di/tricarboxylate transporter